MAKKKTKKKKGKESIEQNISVAINVPFGQALPASQKRKVILADGTENRDRLDEFLEDPEIIKLQYVMLDRSPQNLRWAFNKDNSCITASYVKSQSIKGKGIIATSKDEKLKEIINKYLSDINISWIIDQVIKDNDIHADSVWWLDYNSEKKMIIPRLIDYVTLTRVQNKFTGAVKWIQIVHVDSKLSEKNDSKWRSYEPYIDYYHSDPYMQDAPKDRVVKRHIFEEDTLNFKFYSVAPIETIVEVILWKKWMQFDGKLGGQKYATPLLTAKVMLPESLDISSDEATALLNKISQDLAVMMNHGVIAHPDAVELNTLSHSGQVFNFVQYLEYADKQIHKAIMVPANLLDASGSELATSRTTKDVFQYIIGAMRRMILNKIKDLVLEQLDFIGKKVKPNEFELIIAEEDTQQKMTQVEEFNSLMQMYDRGMIKDPNEVRGYVSKFGMELEQLSEDELELKKMEEFQAQAGGIGNGLNQENNELENEIIKDIEAQLGEKKEDGKEE